MLIVLLIFVAGTTPAQGQTSVQSGEESLPAYSVAGFLQQQFIADRTPGSPVRFAIHRARLGIAGKITDRLRVNFVAGTVEPPNNTPRLVNAFVDFDVHPLFQVRAGQFLLPFGLEGPEPIPFNPAIERSTAIRRLNPFTMFRDVGLQISGSRSLLRYALALVNGTGANRPAQMDPKEILGRVGFRLWNTLELGISGHFGRFQPEWGTDDTARRTRAGVDISYRLEPLFVRGEYIIREEEQSPGETRTSAGGYLLSGYALSDHWEPIARYEYYTPGTEAGGDRLSILTAGFNYYFIDHTRLSINYAFRNNRADPQMANLLQVQMQVVF